MANAYRSSIGDYMPEKEIEKEIKKEKEIEKKNIKSIAGHIIDEKTDEKEKREPESVLDVDEHMSEKQKLSLMNKQQKKEYILEYYAPKALFALVVVGIVVFLVVKHFTAESAALNILAVKTLHNRNPRRMTRRIMRNSSVKMVLMRRRNMSV